ncbi:hypothetical protein D4R75_12365 [bacterium]|nr:MAG: hypothetical protein D4R75_12365 [bacterium]
MKPPRLSLTKRDILRGYQAFSRVITEGRSLQKGAVRCFFTTVPRARGSLQVGFSVSRNIQNAVERNRARRWMKDAYRKNKAILTNPLTPATQAMSVVFMLRVRGRLSRAPGSHATIDQAIVDLLKELRPHLSEKP